MKLHLKEIDTFQGRVVQMPVEEWERYSRQYKQMEVIFNIFLKYN